MNNTIQTSIDTLQPLIKKYFLATAADDRALLEECFSEDTVLYDEGKEYRGSAAVCNHILKANRDAKVTTEVTGCAGNQDGFVVTATLSGEFEGSPISLDFHFTFEDEKIKTLDITLEEEKK